MRRTIAVFGGGALAIVLSQFPEYAQQYTQRLAGAVDELRIIVDDFDRDADAEGMSRTEALSSLQQDEDQFVVRRGDSASRSFARYEELTASLARVRNAGPWERAALLPEFLDSEVGARTLEDFKPAVPVTLEGIAWAGAGFAVGYLIVSALWRFLAMPFRRRYPSGGRI
jgi:hypothetical protein